MSVSNHDVNNDVIINSVATVTRRRAVTVRPRMSYLPSTILKELKEAKMSLRMIHPIPSELVRPVVGEPAFSESVLAYLFVAT